MRQKYQEEIEEILKRAEETAPLGPSRNTESEPRNASRVARGVGRSEQTRGGGARWPTLSPGKIALIGLLLLLLGAVWKGLLVWIGLGLLVLAYLLFFVTPRSISYRKRWRGRPVEGRISSWERFLRWLKS